MTPEEAPIVAYMYCEYSKRHDQTAAKVISSLFRQVVKQQKTVPNEILKSYQNHQQTETSLSKPELFGYLKLLVARSSPTYIIVDALDELRGDHRQSLLEDLRILHADYGAGIMVTSRSLPEIQSTFECSSNLNISAKEEDLQMFVQGAIVKLERKKKFIVGRTDLQSNILEAVVRSADGM